jgi:polyisoprenyl-teichoic acid--peptidoglycan teichoic acid transferase
VSHPPGSDIATPEPRTEPERGPEEPRPPRRGRRPLGVRVERLRKRRRTRIRRQLGAVVMVSVVLAGALVAVAIWRGLGGGRSDDAGGAKPGPSQETWLVIGTREADASGAADWLAVMSHDARASRSLVLYIPRSTLAELPGHGMDTLSTAQAVGKEPLVSAALSNLLGIRFDHILRISDQGERALFDKVGPVTVDVERNLDRLGPDGRSQVVFAEGRQKLSGTRAAEWLAFSDEGGDEISRSVRHAVFWSALLERYSGDDAAALGKEVAAAGDLFSTDATAGDLEGFFSRLAGVDRDSLFFETLPVHATGVDTGTALYATDRASVDALTDRYLAKSRPAGAGSDGRLVQILNGNGVPGIGQAVGDRLVPKGFRIVLNQNARRFDYATTQIVVYSDSSKARALGDEIRAALGVGEVVVSRQSQSLVDVTIVVGKDFVPAPEERAG